MLRNKPHPRVLKSTLRPRLFLAPCPASKIIAPNRESWFFSKRTPEVLTNPLWEVVFCGERGRIKALAEPIFVRGVSTFYDRRTLRPPELEGLRNLPQKFHFPYWGRKGKNKSRYPPKRAGAPPRRAFAPPHGRAFLREVRPHLGLGKNKNTPKRKAKTRRSAAQTSICAAARAGIFTGGSPTSRVRKKTKTPPSAKPKRAGAPPRRAFAPPLGRAFLREVRPHLGLGKKQKHPQAQRQNAPECRSDEHLRRRADGLFTGGSSTSWVREKQKHTQAQSQNAPECRSDEHLRRGADGLFYGRFAHILG